MKYIVIILSFFIFHHAYSIDYICPKTPIDVVIGEVIESDWVISIKVGTANDLNKDIYKNKYKIQYWRGLSGGDITNRITGPKFFIECCNLIKEYGFSICAKKRINEFDCEAVIPRNLNGKEKFVCAENKS